MTITGTWEEIEALADKLKGKQVRLTVMRAANPDDKEEDELDEPDPVM